MLPDNQKPITHKLLILDDDAHLYQRVLEQHHLPYLRIVTPGTDSSTGPFCFDADLILGRPDLIADSIGMMKRLSWVQSTFAGVDALLTPGLRTDYILTGVKGIFGRLMSEYVIGSILARERHLIASHYQQLSHLWERIPYRSLEGLTIGIVGLGSIGRHVAKAAQFFGMRVIGLSRSGTAVNHVQQVFTPSEKNQFLPQLDYLLLVLPATPETHHFIGAAELQMMRKDAVIINVGRGAAIDHDGLIAALRNDIIGGAILDVFEEEPLPPRNPLWNLPQVQLTPHNAAFSFPDQIAALFVRNYYRFLNKQQLEHRIDFQRGY